MTKQPSTGSIGRDTSSLPIFNHAALPDNMKDRYLDKGNSWILMTGYIMKSFNTGISNPSDHSRTTMVYQEYHLGPPVTGKRIFTRDDNYFQLIKKVAARDKQFVFTMPSCHG